MSKYQEIFNILDQVPTTQLRRTTYTATLGNGQGALLVYRADGSRDPGKVWATVIPLGVCAVRCRKVPEKYGLPVIVGYGRDGFLEVVGEDGERAIIFTGNRGASVGNHRWTHDLLGSDPDFVRGLRLMPLLVSPTDPPSLSVYVHECHYTYGGTQQYWPGGSYDLTAVVPSTSSNQVPVIVCLDPATNTIAHVAGTEITPLIPGPSSQPFTGADVAAIDASAYERLVAIRLYTGQTQIVWPDWIADVRPWMSFELATRWDDLRVEPTARTSGTNAPSFEQWADDSGLGGTGTSRGVYLYSFDDAIEVQEKEIFFTMQMPHSWVGTPIHLHVHWLGNADDTTAAPRWGCEYAWQDIGQVFGATNTIYTDGSNYTDVGTDADIVAGKHYIGKFSAITPGSSADNISSILVGRIFRNSSNAADTYDAASNKCGLLYIDAHYENSIGSATEYT